jgi:hypothetical protein
MPDAAIRSTSQPIRFPVTVYNARMSSFESPPSRQGHAEATATFERFRIIRWVVAGIVVWGIFHAIGAWRFNHNPLRAVVVLACVAAFIGFWMTMLAVRQRRLSK